VDQRKVIVEYLLDNAKCARMVERSALPFHTMRRYSCDAWIGGGDAEKDYDLLA